MEDSIGTPLWAFLRSLQDLQRGTGRTTRELSGLAGGELVVIPVRELRRHYEYSIRSLPMPIQMTNVRVIVASATSLAKAAGTLLEAMQVTQPTGILFTHDWIEAYYEKQVMLVRDGLRMFEQDMGNRANRTNSQISPAVFRGMIG